MSEINSWSETAASNNSASPAGWPEGMNPSGVNDSARENMAALARDYNRRNAVITTAGTTPHFTYTTTNTSFPAAYVNGMVFTFKADKASAGNDDLAINSLGAKNLYCASATGIVRIVANQIQSGAVITVAYDSSLNTAAGGFQIINGYLPTTSSIISPTGATFTSGSVLFANSSGAIAQDNAQLFWNDSTHRLGIGTATPAQALDVNGALAFAGSPFAHLSGNYLSIYDNAGNESIFLGYSGDHQNYYRQTTHAFQSIAGGTTFATISSAGLNIATGTLQVGGSQITTGALSDYATGAWTPTDGSGAGLSLTTADCRYVRVGKLVVVSASITYPATGDTSAAKINGLPITSYNGTGAPIGGGAMSSINGAASSAIFFSIIANGTQIQVMQGSAAGTFANNNLSSINFKFTLSYIAA